MGFLPQRRFWRAAIYLVSFLLVLVAVDMVLIQVRRTIHPGFDTTRIVEPLQPDGSIDYLLALDTYYAEGVTPENNAAVPILRALGRAALSPNQPPDGITDRLGMPHLPEEGDYFIRYEDYCRQHTAAEEEDPIDPASPIHWPLTVKPVTREWITANEKPLALLAEACKRARFFIPFYGGSRPETMMEVLLRHVHLMRDARRPLLSRALLRLEAGDVAGFREDVLTVHRLARLMGQAGTMIERMVAAKGMEIPACRIERLAAASGKLSAEEARSLAAELASMPQLRPIAECMDTGERFMVLDTMQTLARLGPVRAARLMDAVTSGTGGAPPGIAFMLLPVPYEETMRVMNHFNDGALSAIRQPTYARRIAALNLWDSEVKKLAGQNPVSKVLSSDWPATIFLPALMQAEQNADVTLMENRLTQVALALAAFKADRGAYPAVLQELSPAYLSSLPDDFFSGRPLVYSRTSDGYRLYSVGPNMIDDGGKSQRPGDDLLVQVP
jgi:hypothetical protein